MKKVCLLFCFTWLVATGQPPLIFHSFYGANGDEIGNDIRQIISKQYIIAGSTTSFGLMTDAYMILVDSMGQEVWQKTFGGNKVDAAAAVRFNPADSGFVLAGYSNENIGYDIFLLRTDKYGDTIWQRYVGGSDWDFGTDCELYGGELIVCGVSHSHGNGVGDGYVAKVDLNSGDLLWEKWFGGDGYDEFENIVITNDGNIFLTGTTESYSQSQDFWIYQISQNGDSIRSAVIGDPLRNEWLHDMMFDKDSNIVFAGSIDTSLSQSGITFAYSSKYDKGWSFVSDVYFTGAGDKDKFYSVVEAAGVGDYVYSRSVLNPGNGIDIQPFKMTSTYVFLHARTYGNGFDDESYQIIKTKDNGFAMVGYTETDSNGKDIFFLKLDYDVSFAPFVAGMEEVKVSHQIYFAEGKLFTTDKAQHSSVQVADISGRIVKRFMIEDVCSDLTDLQTGIYFVTVNNKGILQRLKIVVP